MMLLWSTPLCVKNVVPLLWNMQKCYRWQDASHRRNKLVKMMFWMIVLFVGVTKGDKIVEFDVSEPTR